MDIKLIEQAYGFKINNIENIKNIYKIYTNQGTKCVKRAHMSPSYFLFLYSAVNHLRNNGCEGVIPYNRTQDGRICIEDDKYIYYVTDWQESRECKFKNEEELRKAIKAAAELHRASVGYIPPDGAKPRIYYGKWVRKFKKKCINLLAFSKSIEEKEYIDDFDEIYAKNLLSYWEQGVKSIEMLINSSYIEISLQSEERGEFCHHDMANHNFLIDPDNRIYIIDFDYCIMDTRLHDISSLVIRNMRYGVWDIKKAYFILDEYNKLYSISNKELEVIKAFMIYPQDFWQVGLQYYVEKQPWTMENFLLRLNRVVADKEKRDKFLEDFLKL